tara:strand:+ start:29233 stop:30255 length:1023 start_codon:yes stop_codon:yes gene_type:complete
MRLASMLVLALVLAPSAALAEGGALAEEAALAEGGALAEEAALAQGATRITASLDAFEVGLGEHVVLMVSVEHLSGSSVVWPTHLALGPSIEERGREVLAVSQTGERQVSRVAFTLAVYERSVAHIPPIAFTLQHFGGERESLQTQELAIAVRSSVNPKDAELKPSRAPADAPIRDWNLLIGAAGGLLFLVLFGLVLRARRRPRAEVPKTRVASTALPHEEALAALDAVEASGRLDGEELKSVFHEMSEIMRAYLGRRFDFPALDQTSSEVRSRLRSCPGNHEWGDAMNTWLGRCDLVKYAGADVDADEARTALYSARVLIERTKEAALAQERPAEVARA